MRAAVERPAPDGERGVKVRALQPGDIESLIELWVRSWQATFAEIDFESRREWIRQKLRDNSGTTIVALGRTGTKGFAIFASPCLHQLVVAHREKGRGVAQRLLRDVKARAPDGIVLDVNQLNHRAIAFYEREGFVRVGDAVNTFGRRTWHMRWAVRPDMLAPRWAIVVPEDVGYPSTDTCDEGTGC